MDLSSVHPNRIVVDASLEGMRVVLSQQTCSLQEYNYFANRFDVVEEAAWPLSVTDAYRWLNGWNLVDKAEAIKLLTSNTEPK